jgi:hypothetical protein
LRRRLNARIGPSADYAIGDTHYGKDDGRRGGASIPKNSEHLHNRRATTATRAGRTAPLTRHHAGWAPGRFAYFFVYAVSWLLCWRDVYCAPQQPLYLHR